MHLVSLAVSYAAFTIGMILLLRASKKCTTTAPEDSPVKTEPSHSGQTKTTSLSDDELRAKYAGGIVYYRGRQSGKTLFAEQFGRLSQEDSDK